MSSFAAEVKNELARLMYEDDCCRLAELAALLEKGKFSAEDQKIVDEILKRKKDMSKKTMWMYGGDGWA